MTSTVTLRLEPGCHCDNVVFSALSLSSSGWTSHVTSYVTLRLELGCHSLTVTTPTSLPEASVQVTGLLPEASVQVTAFQIDPLGAAL